MTRHDARALAGVETVLNARIARRDLLRRSLALGAGASVVGSILAACEMDDDVVDEPAVDPDDDDDDVPVEPDDDPDADDVDADPDDDVDPGEDRRGGVLNIAITGEPPTLDIHRTTAAIVGTVGWHFYESLFSFDADFQVIPELVDEMDTSEDGMTITLHLRQGVPFHNGDELTSEDVVASLERWAALAGLGRDVMDATEELVEIDDYTLEFQLEEPVGAFAWMLGRQGQGCAIYPKSLLDEVGEDPISEPIGTGPYRFVEHAPDRHIIAERFEDYAARDGEPDGYGGRKMQYLDEIHFLPVPDESARIAGLLAGDYEYLENVAADRFDELDGQEGVVAEILPPDFWVSYIMNWESPVMENQATRQAAQAAIDADPVLQAGYGEFYRLDPGIMFQETAWHSTEAEELYNQGDLDRAAELLEEAGYDGEPVRWMTTQEYAHHYNNTAVAAQQLEDAGFTVDLEVFDWATVVERRDDPEAWDIFTTRLGFAPDPTIHVFGQLCDWPGWWCSEDSMELMRGMQREVDFDARYELMEQLQRNFYEEVPIIKVGDTMLLNARSARVGGFEPHVQLGVMLWNLWLQE